MLKRKSTIETRRKNVSSRTTFSPVRRSSISTVGFRVRAFPLANATNTSLRSNGHSLLSSNRTDSFSFRCPSPSVSSIPDIPSFATVESDKRFRFSTSTESVSEKGTRRSLYLLGRTFIFVFSPQFVIDLIQTGARFFISFAFDFDVRSQRLKREERR